MTQTSELQSTTHNGETIRYLDTGAGDPAIVFVHGWCCDNTHWRDQVPVFAANHRVIAVDLPGHGSSDKPDRDYTIDSHVDAVAAVIQNLGLDRPVVVGHSMGGMIALNLAYKHPEISRGMVLVDSALRPVPDALKPVVDGALAAMRTPAYKDVAAGFVRTNLFNDKSPTDLVDSVVGGMMDTPQNILSSEITSILTHLNPTGDIPVPTLFLRAATLFSSADELRADWPGLEVAEFDCAHFIQMERPAETNAAIAKFIGGLA